MSLWWLRNLFVSSLGELELVASLLRLQPLWFNSRTTLVSAMTSSMLLTQ